MAQSVLDKSGKLAERLMILRNQEERIVAKTASAAMLLDNSAMAASFAD
jgi:hypothetical protein